MYYIKIVKKNYFKLPINHRLDFNELYVIWSSKKGYLCLFKLFLFDLFSVNYAN